ncbi:flexible cuticle protein 12 [Copidosoma floridanum]|uniref:flexible cuticle protein 12 n=1 Tax=Copidosoma floridanum TaxID=29053 RepID=UPI0006C9736E|nr:flexible cuticle protein 12 [Copidosoma floridanum]
MKTIAVFAALVAVAMAAPQFAQQQQRVQPDVYLLKETPSNNIGIDGYTFGFEQSDGQKREESAQVEFRGPKPEDAIIRVRGSFSYVAPDGNTYTVSYIADENGFQPQGAHLPVA